MGATDKRGPLPFQCASEWEGVFQRSVCLWQEDDAPVPDKVKLPEASRKLWAFLDRPRPVEPHYTFDMCDGMLCVYKVGKLVVLEFASYPGNSMICVANGEG